MEFELKKQMKGKTSHLIPQVSLPLHYYNSLGIIVVYNNNNTLKQQIIIVAIITKNESSLLTRLQKGD
jgi:hypothetical protein